MESLGPGAFARAKGNPQCQVWLGNWPHGMAEEDGKLFLLQEPLFPGCPERRPTDASACTPELCGMLQLRAPPPLC